MPLTMNAPLAQSVPKAACPICGGSRTVPASGYQGKSALFQKRRVVRCEGCGVCRLDPMPSQAELDRYYQEGLFWDHVQDKTPFDIPTYHHQARARIEFLKSRANLSPSFQLLDIGAGFGVLEQNLRTAFPSAALFAVEPDPKAQQSLLNMGVHVKNELRAFEGETFDLLVLSHVLEHMTDPIGYLQGLRRFCRPGSQLFIELPNEDHLFKGYLEPHVLFFSPETLGQTLAKGGFAVKAVATCGTPRPIQKERNRQIEFREKLMRGLPYRQTLRKLKRWIKPEKTTSDSPAVTADLYECAVYGPDRIWIRCLAVPQ